MDKAERVARCGEEGIGGCGVRQERGEADEGAVGGSG